jgi:phosphatidylglycerophosphatase A
MKKTVQDDAPDLAGGVGRARPVVGTISYLMATWFGVGFARIAPGTIATATSLPVYWLLRALSVPTQLALVLLFIGVSVFSADRAARDLGLVDPQVVVIDEVAGTLLALLVLNSSNLIGQLSTLFLFRVLDIFKPWPISLNLWSRFPGVGIVYDDVAAGLAAGLLIRLVAQLFH